MTERVACIECGVLILPSTAERTAGLCMPCMGGYRQEIDAARRRKAQAREQRALAERCRVLLALVFDRPACFTGLTREAGGHLAVLMLELDVCEGGFEQYFWNEWADDYADALHGLRQLGETRSMRCLVEAKEVLFGLGALPKLHVRRRKMYLREVNGHFMLEEYLRELADKFTAQSHSIVGRVEQFIRTRIVPVE